MAGAAEIQHNYNIKLNMICITLHNTKLESPNICTFKVFLGF